jgi:hypothetical protein
LQSAYCAAKHAIKGFTESLRTELLHDQSNVTVSLVNMPALNTPQFSWVKSRLPNRPQPVPPIFQPEVAAEAILYASKHHPRELEVAYPTLKAILAEKLAPGYADRYLAEHAYQSQQTDESDAHHRPDNLWEPMPLEYYQTHGAFDNKARSTSWELWLRFNRNWLVPMAAGLLMVGGTTLWNRRSHRSLVAWP